MNFRGLVAILAMVFLFQSKAMATDTIPAGPVVDIKTTMGDIKVKLYDDTPAHRDNFLKLAKEGYYDGVLFHRVIKDFMVQTGDPDSKDAPAGKTLGSGGPSYTLPAEIDYPKHFHKYGALAAARTGDEVNPERRSSGSQFYIVTGNKYSQRDMDRLSAQMNDSRKMEYFNGLRKKNIDKIRSLQMAGDREALETLRQEMIKETEENVKDAGLPEEVVNAYTTVGGTPHLDGQYTVFGEVIEGMETVEKIQNTATDRFDRPTEDVKVISVKVEE